MTTTNALIQPSSPLAAPEVHHPVRTAVWQTLRDIASGIHAGNAVRHGARVSGRATHLEAHAGAPGLPIVTSP